MKTFKQGEQNTNEEHNVNSLIVEMASEMASETTERFFNLMGIKLEQEDESGDTRYTDDAQDFFNEEYDRQMDLLYAFTNDLMKITNKG